MTELRIESCRGRVVESVHRVSAAVCDASGRLIASSGDPHWVTHLRSAAKPFQALPLIEDGVARRFSITSEELALACASHNSEKRQVELVRAFAERIGCTEDDLACRAHRRLTRDLTVPRTDGYDPTTEDPVTGSRYASSCSGKHVGMLALAKHHGWDTAGYHERGHPVQDRVKRALVEYTGLAASEIGEGVDGCGVVA
nr:asparaginase [Gemmatimonadales bacterium]